MSRIGKKPISIPKGVEVEIGSGRAKVKGPKGEISRAFRDEIEIGQKDELLVLSVKKPTKLANSLWGTYASHLRNMIQGVTEGFSKRLEIEGVGFRAELKGKDLVLSLGFSHSVNFPAPDGIQFKVEKNIITVSGIDKEKVGSVAARIKALKKPEPYKGKGIRYEGEFIRRKAGKKAATTV